MSIGPCERCGAPGQCYAGCALALERRMFVATPQEMRMMPGFFQAWCRYKRAWAQSALGTPIATAHDLDPVARRHALRAFRAGFRAAVRGGAAR